MKAELALWWLGTVVAMAEPVFQVANLSHVPLLKNGDFEQAAKGELANWNGAPRGFQLAPGEGRERSQALVAENASGEGWFGASQTLVLNRSTPAPLVVEGWSKARNVMGGADSGYSLYVDLTYQDGSPLWGQTANFRAGTHDWQMRRFTIYPEKPVKSLTLHCLFRGHAGKAWFDDVRVEEVAKAGHLALFQGAAVEPATIPRGKPGGRQRTIESKDGLRLTSTGESFKSLRVGSRELLKGARGGFLARDVAIDSSFFDFNDSRCAELGLKIQATTTAFSNHIAIQGRVSDLTAKDRAITLVFALPMDLDGWTWGDDIRRSRPIQGAGEYSKQVSVNCGATGTESLYPIAPVWNRDTGLGLGFDMEWPAVFRTGYHAGLKQLFIAYDFALVKETERFPAGAEFCFVVYRFIPAEGFRSAWHKYMQLFPEYFKVRSKEQGLWMPFTDVSKVKGWEDFGFRYHEGNNNVSWDDEHGILSFRYTEPMTWWMPMAKQLPRTLPEAVRVRDELALGNDTGRRPMAVVTRLAAMQDEAGDPALLFRETPWANGAVWSLNPNPWLAASNQIQAQREVDALPLNAATVYWNEDLKRRLYGSGARGHLDGEYLDSLEGYVTAELNFRREHFRSTSVPLTFSTEDKLPALFKGLAVFEFTHWLAADVHRMGKLMFANGVPYRFAYLCPWLDVLGTETDWLQAGQYHPVALETTDLWRTLAGGKPYLLLMNTDYDLFKPELVEKYFQRALFYGLWPGFFSHNAADNPYWQNPRWYERDRPLFKKYIPLIRRVAEAGWEPETLASCDNGNVLLERFGSPPRGGIFLTLFNPSASPQSAEVTIGPGAIRPHRAPKALLGPAPEPNGRGWRLSLQPQEAALWELPQ